MPNVSEILFFYVGNCEPYLYIECQIAYWLWRTVPFLLLSIGTSGNIINIVLLSRKQLRKFSTGVYLLILAMSDLTFLWTGLLPDTIYSITKYRLMDTSEIICRTRFWLALTSASFSVWLLVLLTIERTLLTKIHVFSRTKITPRTATITSLTGLFAIALINSHFIYGYSLHKQNFNETLQLNDNDSSVTSHLLCRHNSAGYEYFSVKVWSIIMFVLYTLIPAVIICTGNINIALVILIRRKKQAKIAPTNRIKHVTTERRKSSAKMLFILSFVFLITTMPYCIYFVVRGQIHEISDRSVARWQLVTVIVNILGWCNFTFNFFLYFINGTLFKQEWQKLVGEVRATISKFEINRGNR